MTNNKLLPMGKSDFSDIIENNYLYIDKTKEIYHIAKQNQKYFLQRPRRFGKSLTLSTLDYLFQGKKELFQGLWIEDKWEWKSRPVVKFNFSRLTCNTTIEDFREDLNFMILSNAKKNNINLSSQRWRVNFNKLIESLSKNGPIAILIDEYDHPLHVSADKPHIENSIKEELNLFYTDLKDISKNSFVFITGITKFSKTSLFSGMNDIEDISFASKTATFCGITQDELEHYFKPYIEELAVLKKKTIPDILLKLKKMYNGYCFCPIDKSPKVYNPYSLINCFHSKAFKYYWFSTGTPTLLWNLFQKKNFDLSIILNPSISEYELSNAVEVISDLSLVSLLYQTGYLTLKKVIIDEEHGEEDFFELCFPNKEVEHAFFKSLARYMTDLTLFKTPLYKKLYEHLSHYELQPFFETWQNIFAAIPYVLHVPQERFYHTLLFVFAHLSGLKVSSEQMTSDGRIDMIIELESKIYIFEFKMDKPIQEAMAQLDSKQYYLPYLNKGKKIELVGVSFNSKTRKIEKWETKEVS